MRYGWVLLLTASRATADTYVIAVGVEAYEDSSIAGVRYACADAKAIAGAFGAAGVPRGNIVCLGPPRHRATR